MQRGIYLAIAYFTVALLGVRMVFVPGNDLITDQVLPSIFLLSMAYACIADSRVQGQPLNRTARWVTVLFGACATSFYVLWSRRAWGILVLLIHIVLLSLTFYLCYFAVFILRRNLL
jgi:hypothetical protein